MSDPISELRQHLKSCVLGGCPHQVNAEPLFAVVAAALEHHRTHTDLEKALAAAGLLKQGGMDAKKP